MKTVYVEQQAGANDLRTHDGSYVIANAQSAISGGVLENSPWLNKNIPYDYKLQMNVWLANLKALLVLSYSGEYA